MRPVYAPHVPDDGVLEVTPVVTKIAPERLLVGMRPYMSLEPVFVPGNVRTQRALKFLKRFHARGRNLRP